MAAIRVTFGALLLGSALCATAAAEDDRELLGVILQQEPRLSSPLATDINRQLRTGRGIEHELNLEQSRVNARSASELQRRQTRRDVQVSEQRLRSFKTESPQARSISGARAPARSGQPPDRRHQPRSRPGIRLRQQPRPERLDRPRRLRFGRSEPGQRFVQGGDVGAAGAQARARSPWDRPGARSRPRSSRAWARPPCPRGPCRRTAPSLLENAYRSSPKCVVVPAPTPTPNRPSAISMSPPNRTLSEISLSTARSFMTVITMSDRLPPNWRPRLPPYNE